MHTGRGFIQKPIQQQRTKKKNNEYGRVKED